MSWHLSLVGRGPGASVANVLTSDYSDFSTRMANTSRLRPNGRHFTDDIFKCIFLNENIWISINISLNFVPKGQINNIPALVPIMAWRRPGDKPLSEPMMVSLLTHICVTWHQWVYPLCTKFSKGNVNMCLQFVSFLHPMTQIVQILPDRRTYLFYIANIMGADALAPCFTSHTWRRKDPGYQQSWYWPI